jgi:hypothetical protein
MRDRKGSLHIFPATPAIGHMPFAGHRPLSEVGKPKAERPKRNKVVKLKAKRAMQYGFDPVCLRRAAR